MAGEHGGSTLLSRRCSVLLHEVYYQALADHWWGRHLAEWRVVPAQIKLLTPV